MSTEEINAPKRRSSAANRRRRRTNAPAASAPAQDAVQQSTTAASSVVEAPVERHIQRRDDRKAAKAKSEKKFVAKVVDGERYRGVRKFYEDAMSEIRKVIWPDREQTRNLTLVVIALSIVMGMLLGGIDWVMLRLFETLG